MLNPRHIQDYHDGNVTTQAYWAYPARVVPCTSDTGTCEYLDAVYSMHVTSMFYTLIMWAAIAGILAVLLLNRLMRKLSLNSPSDSQVEGTLAVWRRRYLTREAPLQWLFGHVTMLQITVLATLSAYLLIFSLIGITYKTWTTPVKKHPGVFNTRTGLGGFGDRVGALAYALTPLTVLLSTRESLLSLITGIPYQNFNFLHRWTGRIIFIQSFLHTLAWTVVEGSLYRPQPSVYKAFIREQYILFGVAAQAFITFLYIFSTERMIKYTGYEFFKKSHTLIAVLYLGACIGHWQMLACWMIAGFALIALDMGVRMLRTYFLHTNVRLGGSDSHGFRAVEATVKLYKSSSTNDSDNNEVLRMDFPFEHTAWAPGQHFYLCFPALSIWQSHPFTPSSAPNTRSTIQQHTYIVRVHKGTSARLAKLAAEAGGECATSIILTGPYGSSSTAIDVQVSEKNLLMVAGGVGVTAVLPLLTRTLYAPKDVTSRRIVDFVWIIRRGVDLLWLREEIQAVKARLVQKEVKGTRVRVFVTREAGAATSTQPSCRSFIPSFDDNKKKSDVVTTTVTTLMSLKLSTAATTTIEDLLTPTANFGVTYLDGAHPDLSMVIADFAERAALAPCFGVKVYGTGPEGMGSVVRSEVVKREWEIEWEGRS